MPGPINGLNRRNTSAFYRSNNCGLSMSSSTAPTSLLSGASQRLNHHARTDRDSYISNATVTGKANAAADVAIL
jgi:hypothetical protein